MKSAVRERIEKELKKQGIKFSKIRIDKFYGDYKMTIKLIDPINVDKKMQTAVGIFRTIIENNIKPVEDVMFDSNNIYIIFNCRPKDITFNNISFWNKLKQLIFGK